MKENYSAMCENILNNLNERRNLDDAKYEFKKYTIQKYLGNKNSIPSNN